MDKPNKCKKKGCQGKLIRFAKFENGRVYKCSVCGTFKDTWRKNNGN